MSQKNGMGLGRLEIIHNGRTSRLARCLRKFIEMEKSRRFNIILIYDKLNEIISCRKRVITLTGFPSRSTVASHVLQ